MNTHTPGPWRANENGGDDDDPRKLIICAYSGFYSDWEMIARADRSPFDGDPEANARLIAAAPDMLAALKAVLSDVGFDDGSINDDPRLTFHAWDAVRAAIAKAEGE